MNWELCLTENAGLIYAPSKRESAVPVRLEGRKRRTETGKKKLAT